MANNKKVQETKERRVALPNGWPEPREDALIGKQWPELVGSFKPIRVTDFENKQQETDALCFFKVGDGTELLMGFVSSIMAAAEKAGVVHKVFQKDDDGNAYIVPSSALCRTAPRKFTFEI